MHGAAPFSISASTLSSVSFTTINETSAEGCHQSPCYHRTTTFEDPLTEGWVAIATPSPHFR